MDDKITVSRAHYEKLEDAYWFLNALRAAGVDNWDGYSEALQEYNRENDEDE